MEDTTDVECECECEFDGDLGDAEGVLMLQVWETSRLFDRACFEYFSTVIGEILSLLKAEWADIHG